ncbi:O-antigen ligase family protein [Thiomicrospira microaerophila]|uniref:O-antigen ligase family protein n=1 Tax=Thiomicrospira microaerophila TaxID=406020 RepID=UPI002010BFFE|nr:O-antigen ligase family protein [Thiomicrospira microaerophila]UQB42430.1 O-antigen ligase family protein [Thiomicrospira microaerophila]
MFPSRFFMEPAHLGVGYASLAVFLFCALALIVPSGYSYGAVMLFLAGLFWFFRASSWQQLVLQDWTIILVLALYGMVWVLEGLVFDYGLRGLDQPFRFFAAIIGLLFLLRFPPKPSLFWLGVVIGSFLTGLHSLYIIVLLDLTRVDLGYTHHIQFGNIALLLGLVSLAGLGWAAEQKDKVFWTALLVVGFLFGLLASLLSGTRGGWVAIPFALLIIYRGLSTSFRWRQVVLGSGALFFVGLFAYLQPVLGVKDRVDLAVQEVGAYYQSGEVATSVGARLEMWRGALIIGQENPVYGVGDGGYQQRKFELIELGELDGFVAQFGHPHNEYLERFVKFGLVGLLSLLLLYFLPLRVFLSFFNDTRSSVRAYATAGAVLCVCYIDFSFTQSFFAHNSGVMVFAFMLIIIWAMLSHSMRSA